VSGRNGGRPFFPPLPPQGQPVGLQVAAPFNDIQLVGLMAAMISAGLPPMAHEEANAQAQWATEHAVRLLGHVAYRVGSGELGTLIQRGTAAGEAMARQALEAEEQQARGEGPGPDPAQGETKPGIILP